MQAIKKLRRAGLDTKEIASGIGCSIPLVYMYENGKRFPGERNFRCIVELAESRGMTLLARDFVSPAVPCEAA